MTLDSISAVLTLPCRRFAVESEIEFHAPPPAAKVTPAEVPVDSE